MYEYEQEGKELMAIWHQPVRIEDLQKRGKGTLVDHIGIEFLEIGDDYLRARMPVDERTVQPFGLLHGGASVSLAETLGSVAANVVRHSSCCVYVVKEPCWS